MPVTSKAVGTFAGQKLIRAEIVGGDNAINSLSLALGHSAQIVEVCSSYTAAPTAAAPVATLTTGFPSTHILPTGLAANTADQRWTPTALYLMDDDALSIVAPAGGAGIINTITVYALAP